LENSKAKTIDPDFQFNPLEFMNKSFAPFAKSFAPFAVKVFYRGERNGGAKCAKYILLFFLLFLSGRSYSQLSAGSDDTINPGVPVTLSASYGLIANGVTTDDDGVEGPFPIGFDFTFYGDKYSNFYIGANGWISFSADVMANARNAFKVPGTVASTFNPKICILGPFQDFNPIVAGAPYIFYKTIGEQPDRKLVVMWCQTPMRWCEQAYVTFQIVLCEGDTLQKNIVENHIYLKPACFNYDTNRATLGIQNAYKILGISVPGRNATSWSVDAQKPEGWRYTPVDQDTYRVDSIPFNLQPVTPGNKITYSWYHGQEFISDQQSITVAPNETSTYTAVCSLCEGKEFRDDVTVYVVPWIPNAFSPNGDGLNDNFRILGLPPENIIAFNMQIFNRWGQVVFSSNDILIGWDGRTRGEICPEGDYSWVIFYEDSKKIRTSNKGTVTLLR
jgi:gliding motility-associated-like protein